MDLAESMGLMPVTRRDADGKPALEDDEQLLDTFEAVQLFIGSDADQGVGKLYITEGRVIWLSSEDASRGYAADFPTITMHAVATDPESVQRPCLYVQLDREEESGFDDGEEEQPLPELSLVPADPASLDRLFAAFCAGAERNPDADAEEGQDSLFCDHEEVLAGAVGAALDVNDVADLVGGDPDRFEDPKEEEDEDEDGAAADEHAEDKPQNGTAR